MLPSAAEAVVEPLEVTRRPGADLWRAVAHNRKAVAGVLLLGFFLVLAIFPGQIAPDDPQAEIFGRGLGPSSHHWFGTTAYGQDVLSQLIWGTRQSIVIALAVGGLATALAVLVGVSAAYLGGIADGVLSLLTDVILVIPIFPLIIVIAAYEKNSGLFTLVVVLGVLGWSYGARQLRSQTLSLRTRDFVEAARVRGERRLYVIVFEILPTMTSLIVASFLGAALYAVLFAAGLQFIGLGDPNSQSWGTMLYWAENNEALGAGMAYWAIMPGVCVALLGAAFALLNYAFDEISSPALRLRKLERAGVDAERATAVLAVSPDPKNILEVRGLSVAYACEAHSTMNKRQIEERSREVLRLVSIDPVHLHSYPHQLSGGMRQRAMIAMALLFTPELIIMDEPTSALDVVGQRSLMVQIKELQEQLGFAIVFVTHDMSLVRHFSDRLLVMYAAQVAELGRTAQLFRKPLHPYTHGLLEAFPSVHGPKEHLLGIPGAPPDLVRPPAGCRFAPRCPHAYARCRAERPRLLEVDGELVRCFLHEQTAVPVPQAKEGVA